MNNWLQHHIKAVSALLISAIVVLVISCFYFFNNYFNSESHLKHLAEVKHFLNSSHIDLENYLIDLDPVNKTAAQINMQKATTHLAHLAMFEPPYSLSVEDWSKKIAQSVEVYTHLSEQLLSESAGHDNIYVHASLTVDEIELAMLQEFETMREHLTWLGSGASVVILAVLALLMFVVIRYQRVQQSHLQQVKYFAEDRQLIIDNMREGVLILDKDKRVAFANKSMLNLMGMNELQLKRMAVASLLFQADGHRIENNELIAQLNGGAEFSLQDSRGELIPVDVTVSTLPENEEKCLLIARDLRIQKLAEKALIRAKENAEEGDKVKSSFIASISHELRTPLNGILGMLQLLQDAEVNERDREYIDASLRASNTLLALLNDVLDFSKIEAMKLELDPQPANLRDVLRSSKLAFEPAALQKRLEIKLEIDPMMPALLIVDALRLQQVLNNLLSNAVKFTDAGFVELGARVLHSESESVKLRIWVRDTGIGIAPEQQQELFKPFYQAKSSHQLQSTGTGLGLAISQRLVQLMGGEIVLESVRDQGAYFFFDLNLPVQLDKRIHA